MGGTMVDLQRSIRSVVGARTAPIAAVHAAD
jgi:hypothetical protein